MSPFYRATGMTPEGVVLTGAKPLTPEWFAARRLGITGTDLPKILDLSKYGNAVDVWLDKRDSSERDDVASEAAEWGRILEEPVAREWERRVGTKTAPIETLRNRRRPWAIANLDRIVRDCPDVDGIPMWGCGLEVKTRSAWVGGDWGADMPDDVLAQTAWEAIVTGYPHIHVACLLGGQRLEVHRYDRDPELEAYVIDKAEAVWGAVLSGERPDAAPSSLLTKVLDRLYPDRTGVVDLDPTKGYELVDAYETARLLEKSGKLAREAAKARLVEALDGAEVATTADETVGLYTYKANKAGTRSIAIAPGLRKDDDS